MTNQDSTATAPTPKSSWSPRKRQFAQHAFVYTAANLLYLFFNGILAFIVPRLMPVEDYGYYRLFVLYAGFVGFVHFGFIDGALMRWAAEPEKLVDAETPAANSFNALLHLVAVTAALLLCWLFWRDWLWLVVGVCAYAVVWNWSMQMQFAAQAKKRFHTLSIFTVGISTILLASALLLYQFHRLNYRTLSAAYVIAAFVPTLALAGALANLPLRFAGLRQTLALAKTNIDLGWSVLLANLATLLLVSIDRIWVGASFPIREFAIYSFAANALAILYNPITAISRVLFPYLADTSNSAARERAYHTGEFGLLLAWSVGMAAFFPLRWFVAAWLPAYIGSMPILLLFLIGTAFVAPVAILHAAYMKVALRQKQFLLGASVATAVTCSVLWFAVRAHSLEGCAVSILVGNACWWGVNQYFLRDFVSQRMTNVLRVIATIAVAGGALVWLAGSPRQAVAMLAYGATAALLFAILWRTELRHLRVTQKLSSSFGRVDS